MSQNENVEENKQEVDATQTVFIQSTKGTANSKGDTSKATNGVSQIAKSKSTQNKEQVAPKEDTNSENGHIENKTPNPIMAEIKKTNTQIPYIPLVSETKQVYDTAQNKMPDVSQTEENKSEKAPQGTDNHASEMLSKIANEFKPLFEFQILYAKLETKKTRKRNFPYKKQTFPNQTFLASLKFLHHLYKKKFPNTIIYPPRLYGHVFMASAYPYIVSNYQSQYCSTAFNEFKYILGLPAKINDTLPTVEDMIKAMGTNSKTYGAIKVTESENYSTSIKKTIISTLQENKVTASLFKSYFVTVKVCDNKCIPDTIKITEESCRITYSNKEQLEQIKSLSSLQSYSENHTCSRCHSKQVTEYEYPFMLAPILIIKNMGQTSITKIEDNVDFDSVFKNIPNRVSFKQNKYQLIAILTSEKVIFQNIFSKNWSTIESSKITGQFKLPKNTINGNDILMMYINSLFINTSEAHIFTRLNSWVPK